jgi:hypothetical protein
MKGNRTLVNETYQVYLDFLKDLISIKTVYKDPSNVEKGIQYCLTSLRKTLPNWTWHRDAGKNLLYINPALQRTKPILYLCAHIDTVDANQSEWHQKLNPFEGLETSTHIIGRGANDCKAGVALILYIAFLLRLREMEENFNLSFLISFKEEGNQGKSSRHYVESFNSPILLSRNETCFVSLENTISIKSPYELAVYHREPGNFFIEVFSSLAEIRNFITSNDHWKPVVIRPLNYGLINEPWKKIVNNSGHIATVKNQDNLIYKMIMNSQEQHLAIRSGDPEQTSVLQKDVYVSQATEDLEHSIILNYRGFADESCIRSELKMH